MTIPPGPPTRTLEPATKPPLQLSEQMEGGQRIKSMQGREGLM